MFSVGCGIIDEEVDGRLERLTMRGFVDFRDLNFNVFVNAIK
jgi:hypothetical protein